MPVSSQSLPLFEPAAYGWNRPYPLASEPRRIDFFLKALGCTMATGCLVLFEPAPIDLAIIGLLALGLILGKLQLHRIHQIPLCLLAAFAVANIVSLWDPIDSVRGIFYTGVTFYLMASTVFFFAVASAQGKKAVDVILTGYIIAAILNVLVAAGGYFQLLPGQEYLLLYGRPKGLFKDPNVYGPYVVPVATYALAQVLAKGMAVRRRIWWYLVLGISVAGTFLSFSRACWFNCLVSLLLLTGFGVLQSSDSRQIARKIGLALSGLAVTGGLLFAVANVPAVSTMLKIRLGSDGLQSYDRMRFYTHSRALQSAIDRPLGIGSGQSEIAFQYATHSTYLRVLSENGLLGAFSLFSLFALTVFRSIRMAFVARDPYWRQLFTVLSACLIGQLLNCFVIDSLHWRHLWVLLGLAWTARGDQ